MSINPLMKTAPAVFAVGTDYQIMVETTRTVLFSVLVDGEEYFDASNGIMRSMSDMHRVSVPMDKLDKAKEYTVSLRPIIERKPYFTETEPEEEQKFCFRPVPSQNARAYHLADCHNLLDSPVRAAKAFGETDFLILNGDVIDHSGSPDKFAVIYEICALLTNGERPVVFARGNHDLRGEYAEKFAEYTPQKYGNTYYTFRLGSIWGIILDCGEDKTDDHLEYGFTVACHAFRKQQTAFIEDVIRNAKNEYEDPDVATRLVICHIPFSEKFEEPFGIEEEIYREWCRLLKTYVKPHLMISGHMHKAEIRPVGHETDTYGQPCTVVVGSECGDNGYMAGCGFVFGEDSILCTFTGSDGETRESVNIDK